MVADSVEHVVGIQHLIGFPSEFGTTLGLEIPGATAGQHGGICPAVHDLRVSGVRL